MYPFDASYDARQLPPGGPGGGPGGFPGGGPGGFPGGGPGGFPGGFPFPGGGPGGFPGGGPGGFPGGFPFPGGGPGGFPGGFPFPGGGIGTSGPPSGPPPSFVPTQPAAAQISLFAVDPGALRPCLYRYVYLWLRGGRSFWAWLVFVGRNSAAGWRWTGYRWVYFGVDLDRIVYFVCF